jgi:hypothetical protein
MATAPKFLARDGSGYVQEISFSSSLENLSLEGLVDVSSVDIQVSINDTPYVSDPSLVSVDQTKFIVPNPEYHPDGLVLELGANTISVRVVDIVGGISAPAVALIDRVQRSSDTLEYIPTGLRVRRRRDNVDILVAKIQPSVGSGGDYLPLPTLRGFNFYASTAPGGATGYVRINDKLVLDSIEYEEDTYEVGKSTTQWPSTTLTTRVRVTEEDDLGTEINVRQDIRYNMRGYLDDVRLSHVVENVSVVEFVRFRHSRSGGSNTINTDQFIGVSDSAPLYYVVTGVYWDPSNQAEFETPFSQEVLGTPLVIDTTIRDLPGRTQSQVAVDYLTAIQRVDREISLIPGSTTRDVSIDPFASESERIWFLVDFVHRCQSFLTLIQIDDANADGISDPAVSSAYKQALKAATGFTTDDAVQSLIDQQFDKLAANFNKPRLAGRAAVGQVTIYTTTRPAFNIVIPSGTFVSTDTDSANSLPSVRYGIGGTYTLLAANADSYYNFDQKRWEIVADIVAETVGSSGNRPAGQIKNISGVSGVFVTNTEATMLGTDREPNGELAVRSMLGFASVDTGTEGGYTTTAANQVGVIKSKIVKSGDALMMRDWDSVRNKHIGGKVDLWIQGMRERQVTDRFAFSFDIAKDSRCKVVDAANLVFRVVDSRVTPDTPLVEVLDNPSQGLGVRNVSLGEDYDLTGVHILDYQTFQLNALIPQPSTSVDDVITADYRFRTVHAFIFTMQPVRRVVSVVGEISGSLTPDVGYKLFKTEDPLLEGESTIAKDHLTIYQVGGVPSGDSIQVNDETHILIGFVEEPLLSIGVNTRTVRVFKDDRSLEYSGPGTTNPDFDVVEGTSTTPAKIVRTSSSMILSGESVSVDYTHDENFTVMYVVNDLLQELQRSVNKKRHVTADVLVKQAIQNSVEIETTAQLYQGAKKDTVDPAVRTAVSLELNKRYIGQGVAQSDVIHAVDATSGVDYQIVPMVRMAYADGSKKLRESLRSSATRLGALDIGGNVVFILTNALQYPTIDTGGYETEHRAVFQDGLLMSAASILEQAGSKSNQAFIIGSGGASIAGYSDDVTLIAEGFTDPTARETERLRRTANHVVVSLSGSGDVLDDPTNHAYAASYVVRGDSGSHDITASSVEFLDLGTLTITYRAA